MVEGGGVGAKFELRDIPNAESGLSPLGIWCCEAQERYVLAIKPEALAQFKAIAKRERCPYAVVGYTTQQMQLKVHDQRPSKRGKPDESRKEEIRPVASNSFPNVQSR